MTGLGRRTREEIIIDKWDQTGSPEIPDRGEISEILWPPFGGFVNEYKGNSHTDTDTDTDIQTHTHTYTTHTHTHTYIHTNACTHNHTHTHIHRHTHTYKSKAVL